MNPSDLLHGSDRLLEANNLYGSGAVHEKRHELQDAQKFYEEALAIYEEVFGTHHPTTGLVTRNLARVLKAQGKDAESALMEDLATEILSKRAADDDAAIPFGGSARFFSLIGFNHQADADDGEGRHRGAGIAGRSGASRRRRKHLVNRR